MRQLCKRRRSIFPKRKLRCFCPRHLRIKRRTRWFSRLMHFQMRVPYSLESFRKCFADGTSLCSVTSSRYSEHRARPWFGSITAGDLPSDPIDEHNTEYLLGKYQHFPYKTIKGNANKTLPPTQCQVPVYQLPVIIYIRRPRGGARCWRRLVGTRTWCCRAMRGAPHVNLVGIRADLGMLLKERYSQCAAPLRSTAKHRGLAKHAEKHTFLKHRRNQSYSFQMYLSTPRNDSWNENLISLMGSVSCPCLLHSHCDLCTQLLPSLISESCACEKMR